MKALAALALLLLLAGAAQAGSSQHLLEGSAASVILGGAETHLQGPLGVVDVVGGASDSMAFHLQGTLRMEIDHENVRGFGVTYQPDGAGTDRPSGTFLAADGVTGRDNRELVVFPLAGQSAQVAAGASSVSVSTPSSLAIHHTHGTERQPESVLAQGLRVSGSGLEVRGSFAIAVWEWDFTAVGEDGQPVAYWTGLHETPVAGLPQETTPVARDDEYRQAFLFVTDGVLTIPAEGQAIAYLPAGAADVHGDLTLQGVRADMAGPSVAQQVSADRFSIHGDLRLDLGAPIDGRVPFQASGQGRPVIEVDGATLQWAGASHGWPTWATWVAAGLFVVLAPPAAVGARRGLLRWESRRLAFAEGLLEMEEYAEARHAVRPLLRSRRLRAEASVIHVESLLAEGRAEEALPVLAEARLWRLAPALRDYLVARAEAILGHVEDARDALARAFAAAPDLRLQAATEPALRPLIQDTPEGYT
jgi:hypothetical protein